MSPAAPGFFGYGGRRGWSARMAAAALAALLVGALGAAPARAVSTSGVTVAATASGGLRSVAEATAAASGTPFADVAPAAPYAAAIADLADAGVLAGYGDGSFRPDAPLTRQQFAKVIVEALDLPVSEADVVPFSDVDIGGPGTLYPDNYVAAAARERLVLGTGAGRFAPYAPLTRAQLVTMLVRTSGHPPERLALPVVPAGFVGSLGIFDPTHGPAARRAEYAGLLHGLVQFDQDWDPWSPATRGEAAQLLWNLLWLKGRQADVVDRSPLVAGGDPPVWTLRTLAMSADALAWIRLELDSEGFAQPQSVRALHISGGADAVSRSVPGPTPFWAALALDGTTVAWNVALGGEMEAEGAIWVNDIDGTLGRFLDTEPALRFLPSVAGHTVYWGELRIPAGAIESPGGWLMAQDLGGGDSRVLGRSRLPLAIPLATESYVLWVAGEGEGGSRSAYSLYDVSAGRIVSEWDTDRGRDGYVDGATDIDGDFALLVRNAVEQGAGSVWWRRSWLVLRHLPSGREMTLDTPGAYSFRSGPELPGRTTALELTGLDGDSVWGVSTTHVRQAADQPHPDTHWSLWVRNISAEKALLAGDAPPPEQPVPPGGAIAVDAPPLLELAFGGPGSELLDAEIAGGRLAWAVRESSEQVVYLRNAAPLSGLGGPNAPASMGGSR